MTTKTRRILEALTRDELQELVAQHDLQVRDRRVREELIEAVAGSRKVDLAGYLGGLSRDRLKAICRSLEQRLGELVDLIGTIGLGSKESQSKDILGRVYEYFLSEFALAEGRKGGQPYTPRSVVRVPKHIDEVKHQRLPLIDNHLKTMLAQGGLLR